MKREVEDYINDIIEAIEKALDFIKDMSYEDFVKDEKTIFAVVRAIEIIGEAVKNIPEELKTKYNKIPWKAMSGMRDKLIHAYFGIDVKVVWDTVKKRLPDLKFLFEEIRKELRTEGRDVE
jgi:uncharacterized protein with HEPN domain